MGDIVQSKANFKKDITVPLFIGAKEDYGLMKDESQEKVLVEAAKENVDIPVIDMEKMVFYPRLSSGEMPQSITFDLYFRKRDLDGWNTDDSRGWNSSVNGSTPLKMVSGGDSYMEAGFNEDDVYYQKDRLKQSFIRILFYDGKNPLTQKLLCYSTVFIDTNKMFKRFLTKEQNGISFSVFDRDYSLASSEGFYAYFFPDERHDEREGETIYMKIEFNHAGYGKTIPMIVPIVTETIPTGFYVGGQLDIEKYWDNLYIPIVAKRENGIFSYVFPDDRIIKSTDGQTIRLVLIEPKINE